MRGFKLFEAGTLTIRRSFSQIKGAVRLKATKTGRTRVVPLSRLAADALGKQKARQAADRLAAGQHYRPDPEGAVFTDEFGDRTTPMAATNAFARLAKKAKLSTTRLHDVRHTSASHLIGAGVDIRTTAAVLGHINPNVTLAIYARLLEGSQRDAVDRLGDRMERLAK